MENNKMEECKYQLHIKITDDVYVSATPYTELNDEKRGLLQKEVDNFSFIINEVIHDPIQHGIMPLPKELFEPDEINPEMVFEKEFTIDMDLYWGDVEKKKALHELVDKVKSGLSKELKDIVVPFRSSERIKVDIELSLDGRGRHVIIDIFIPAIIGLMYEIRTLEVLLESSHVKYNNRFYELFDYFPDISYLSEKFSVYVESSWDYKEQIKEIEECLEAKYKSIKARLLIEKVTADEK